jgi:hypothetical protein
MLGTLAAGPRERRGANVKLAAMMQGIMTLPKRVWLIVSALALSCGAAVAAIHGASEPAPAPPAAPATAEVTAEATASAPTVSGASAATAAGEHRRFLPQTRDESVVLDFSSQGCFGGAAPARFEIRGENPRVVRVVDPGDGSIVREIALDEEARKELERTIAFYRAPPGDVVCSTVDVVQISFRQGDEVVWTETHEDSTCETEYQDAPWSLAALFDAERRASRNERMSRQALD